MNGLKASGEINDWKSVAYDWRLSLDDLLNKGAERDGKIFYEESTSTPYIEQTLRGLASSSKSGKVTIVAHSNGGLLAKALLNQLSGETPKLVDKVILVGAPQSGAPEDLGVLLEGYNAGIYKSIFTIVSNSTMQSLAKNSPTAYHLLPSANYFSSIASDTDHPVAKFEGQGYELERGTYGDTIKDVNTLDNYLRDAPQSMNGTLIDYANREHHTLDDWAPPSGIEVDQIAGWGADTVAGIDFYTRDFIGTLLNVSNQTYKPIFTEDGDGVVPVPSALAMPTNNEVKNYWVNLDAYHKDTSIKRSHADLFEVPQLEDFIKNIIESGSSTPAIPAYISNTQPAPIVASKELIFFLHSDQAIQVTDSSGDVTGVAPGNSIKEDIPDSSYGSFGEVKWVKVKEGDNYHISVEPQQHQQSEQNEGESEPTNTGFIHLDVEERSNNIVTASSTLARVAATASTTVATDVSGGGVETISTPVITGDDNNQNNQNNQNEVVHLYHYARP